MIVFIEQARSVKIGYGNVAEMIAADRRDPEILACEQNGTLQVTWGATEPEQMMGIVRSLSDQLTPLIKITAPYAAPIPVNLPSV
jgi:hypothetical protein